MAETANELHQIEVIWASRKRSCKSNKQASAGRGVIRCAEVLRASISALLHFYCHCWSGLFEKWQQPWFVLIQLQLAQNYDGKRCPIRPQWQPIHCGTFGWEISRKWSWSGDWLSALKVSKSWMNKINFPLTSVVARWQCLTPAQPGPTASVCCATVMSQTSYSTFSMEVAAPAPAATAAVE